MPITLNAWCSHFHASFQTPERSWMRWRHLQLQLTTGTRELRGLGQSPRHTTAHVLPFLDHCSSPPNPQLLPMSPLEVHGRVWWQSGRGQVRWLAALAICVEVPHRDVGLRSLGSYPNGPDAETVGRSSSATVLLPGSKSVVSTAFDKSEYVLVAVKVDPPHLQPVEPTVGREPRNPVFVYPRHAVPVLKQRGPKLLLKFSPVRDITSLLRC